MIVLDANILIRAVLGRRVKALLEQYRSPAVRFFAPEVACRDAERHLPALLERFGKPAEAAFSVLPYVLSLIEVVEDDLYFDCVQDAKQRLAARDEEDWPVLALGLALDVPVWTEDMDFFGVGHPTWTTKLVEIYFKKLEKDGHAL